MKRITIIGHFGWGHECLDGQTVKTKIFAEELEQRYGRTQVLEIDTQGGAKTLFKSLFHVAKAFFLSQNIIMLPAQRGVLVYGRLLVLFKKLFRARKIHYVVVGGWLSEYLGNRLRLIKCLKEFDGIYVETDTMKTSLDMLGFQNIYVIPNCKKLKPLAKEEVSYINKEPYKLCTFSRVMKEKGIEDAVQAVKEANEKFGRTVFTLDIYGQVDTIQMEWFEKMKKEFPAFVQYRGSVSADKSVEVLKGYFALLFPTYYEGEGFAGTLIDAFSAGVPVVASDWKYNKEIIQKDVTGRLFTSGDINALTNELIYIYKNVEQWNKMRILCIAKADEYRVENVIKKFTEHLA